MKTPSDNKSIAESRGAPLLPMRFLILALCFALAAFAAMAQKRSIIVCDSLSKNPLPHIAVYAGNGMTLTNEEGGFILHRASDSISIEVPFKNRRQHIPQTAVKDTILINAAIHLEPITVISGKSILEKAMENFSRNYNTNQECNFSSFVRSAIVKNGEYTHFQEIVTRSCLPNETTFLGRKSKGIGTAIKGMRRSSIAANKKSFDNYDLVRCLSLTPYIERFQKYDFETVESYADGWRFSYNFSDNGMQQKGWFLINKEDYALTESDESFIPKNLDVYQESRLKLPAISTVHRIYGKQNGVPYYSRRYTSLYEEYFLSDKERTKTDSLVLTFDIFHYEYEYKNPEKIKLDKNVLFRPVSLLIFPYDKSFWDNYKSPALTSAQRELLTELEHKQPFID